MKYLIAVVFTLCSLNLYTQNAKLGISIGGNYSKLLGDFEEIIPSERRVGLQIGLYRDFKLTENIIVSPQLIYSSQGLRSPYSESVFPIIDFVNGNPVEGTVTIGNEGAYILNYLNLPIQFKYLIKDDLGFILGPQFGYLLNAKFKGTTTTDGESEEENSKIDFDNKVDFGGVIGFSYFLQEKFLLELKYYQGFSNVNKDEDIIIGGDEPVKMLNSVLQFSIGYRLF
ncbi:MAG: PorT family protein [Muriicola sp.]|nr:PorT family protein [Muriicola sp.]NNK11451.1 PorT family protein [Flavobacteriaceae bacterium]